MRIHDILIENVISQRDLETLAKHIIDALVDTIGQRLAIKWRDETDWSILGHISTYYDLQKRLPRSMRALARYHHGLHVNFTTGSSFYKNGSIVLNVPEDFLKICLAHKDEPKIIRAVLMHSYPDLVHELTHLYDDRRSKGKYVTNAHSQETGRRQRAMYADPNDETEAAWSNSYLTDPAEVNAWFQSAVSTIHDHRNDSFDDYRNAFEDQYPHYRQLSTEKQQRLIKRLYAQWRDNAPRIIPSTT